MRTRMLGLTIIAAMSIAGFARADAVSDALDAAQTAYAAGKLSETAAALINASGAVKALQAERLAAFLPEPIAGWTREINTDAGAGMAMMGMAGTTAEGRYSHDDGRSITMTLSADSPLVASMGGMLGSPQMMAMMGKVMKVGGLDMLVQDNALSALVGMRVLVQAQGDTPEAMAGLMASMNLAGLAQFDE